MSLTLCEKCKNVFDTDQDPDGYYVEGHEGEYICENCVENNNLEYDVC